MKQLLFILITAFTCSNSFGQQYPYSKTVDSSDTWYNITIKDPYRWMEDLKSEETIEK